MVAEYKLIKRLKRKKRVRAKIFGTLSRPRLSVFRSNKHIYAQIIDDKSGKTLVAASDLESTKSTKSKAKSAKSPVLEKHSKMDAARIVGSLLAKKALEKRIKRVAFDRGSYRYHGRVKALAEALRKGGLIF